MELDDYQRQAMTTSVLDGNDNQAIFEAMFGLAEESGEVCGKFKRVIRDGDSIEDYKPALKKELGDVLWYLAVLSKRLGFSLQEIAEANIEKLKDRANRGVIKGSGDER